MFDGKLLYAHTLDSESISAAPANVMASICDNGVVLGHAVRCWARR